MQPGYRTDQGLFLGFHSLAVGLQDQFRMFFPELLLFLINLQGRDIVINLIRIPARILLKLPVLRT